MSKNKLTEDYKNTIVREVERLLNDGYAGTKPKKTGDSPTDRDLVERVLKCANENDADGVAEAYNKLEDNLESRMERKSDQASKERFGELTTMSGANRYYQNMKEALGQTRGCARVVNGEQANVRRSVVLQD